MISTRSLLPESTDMPFMAAIAVCSPQNAKRYTHTDCGDYVRYVSKFCSVCVDQVRAITGGVYGFGLYPERETLSQNPKDMEFRPKF